MVSFRAVSVLNRVFPTSIKRILEMKKHRSFLCNLCAISSLFPRCFLAISSQNMIPFCAISVLFRFPFVLGEDPQPVILATTCASAEFTHKEKPNGT